MGNNYYWWHYGDEVLHIGKSSYGWCFSLHVIPELGINSLTDWVSLFSRPGSKIMDENGDTLTENEMLLVIMFRSTKSRFSPKNGFVLGPNNLARHPVSEEFYCVGHGEGPWDYITGDFS